MEKEEFTFDPTNFEQQKAFDLVANTNNSLFITGKAGTGKTAFVKRIQMEINKNFLVLAPRYNRAQCRRSNDAEFQ